MAKASKNIEAASQEIFKLKHLISQEREKVDSLKSKLDEKCCIINSLETQIKNSNATTKHESSEKEKFKQANDDLEKKTLAADSKISELQEKLDMFARNIDAHDNEVISNLQSELSDKVQRYSTSYDYQMCYYQSRSVDDNSFT